MCGIVGFLGPARIDEATLTATAMAMADRMRLRGPDDGGAWVDGGAGIALAHRRLAIVDLSAEGHQPMRSACGRYVLTFNGEIYNFKSLRAELEQHGHGFRGHSDTEVMLAAFQQWGVRPAIARMNGMFAFGLWDREERTLHLARDRMGEKPLYYGWIGDHFFFASELKPLSAHPSFRRTIRREAIALLLRFQYIPAPWSIYEGIFKLPPATTISVRLGPDRPSPEPYWSASEAAARGIADPLSGTPKEAVRELDHRLREAVRLRMEADVPLGAFLSGGIDSSTVVALMQSQSTRPVKTFTIGFAESAFNEASEAKAIARHLGTDHTELVVTPQEALAVIPQLPSLFDEPFADSSQVPTFLVARLARRHVTVSLSGDGGDELFCGYPRYARSLAIDRVLGRLPGGMGPLLAYGLASAARTFKKGPLSALGRHLRLRGVTFAAYAEKLGEFAALDGRQAIYQRMISHWTEPAKVVLGVSEPEAIPTRASEWSRFADFRDAMMYIDTVSYLPDDILAKVDRASMGVSLESRVPLLDHSVVEFAWRIPRAWKVLDGRGKWPLREVLYRYVPRALVDRPKRGFAMPIAEWLRGPLRPWAEELLDERRLREEGFFDPRPIRARWAEHLASERNWDGPLWDVLMFEAWLANEERAP